MNTEIVALIVMGVVFCTAIVCNTVTRVKAHGSGKRREPVQYDGEINPPQKL